MEPNEIIIKVAEQRRQLQLIRDALIETQVLCARSMSTVQESQELLHQVDDLRRRKVESVLHKNKYGV